MKRLYFLILALAAAAATSAQIPNGLYEGLEKFHTNWYHRNLLVVDNDSLFLYKDPMHLVKGKLLHSAADGGFFYFFGTYARTDTGTMVYLAEYNCDYCGYRIRVDSSTGFVFRLPRLDTFRLLRTSTGFTINKVAYHKSNTHADDFPTRSEFYPDPDSNYIHRYDPKGQYQLISTGIKNFLQTNLLTLDNDTLRICLDRKTYDSAVETLNPAMIRPDTSGIKLCFYTPAQLKQLTSTSTRPVRYIQVEGIIDYWKAARLTITYAISLPKSIHHFSEYEHRALFEYKKIGNTYDLITQPVQAGYTLSAQLVEQK